MTISSLTNQMLYTGNGSASVFAFTFKIFDQDDLLVVVTGSDGIQTELVIATDYTVSGVNSISGGNVTLVDSGQAWLSSGNLATGYTLSIRRVLSLTQPTDLRNQGPYYPETVENQLDRAVMIAQQQQAELDKSMRAPETDATNLDLTLPSSEERASKFLAFDSSGEPIASSGTTDGSVPVSSFMETVLDDTTAAAARTTLGFSGASGTVATGNIEDGAVTRAKLAAGAVGTPNVATKTTTYTATTSDDVIFASTGSAWTLTIPSTVKRIYVQKTSSDFNKLTISGTSLSTALDTQNESVEIVYNGTAHVVLRRYIPSILTSYTPTFTGFGTVSGVSFYYSRVGDALHIQGIFTSGTSTAVEARISLPGSLSTAFAQSRLVGAAARSSAAAVMFTVLAGSTENYVKMGIQDGTRTGTAAQNGDQLVSSGNSLSLFATVPINGWNG